MAATQEKWTGVMHVTTEDILVKPSRKNPGDHIKVQGWANAAAFSTNHFVEKSKGEPLVPSSHIHRELGQIVDRIPFTILTGIHESLNVDGYLDVYRFKPDSTNRKLPRKYLSEDATKAPYAIRLALTNLSEVQASLRPQGGGVLFVMKSGDSGYAAHIGSVIGKKDKTFAASSDGWIAPNTRKHVEVLLGDKDLSGIRYILAGIKTVPIAGSN